MYVGYWVNSYTKVRIVRRRSSALPARAAAQLSAPTVPCDRGITENHPLPPVPAPADNLNKNCMMRNVVRMGWGALASKSKTYLPATLSTKVALS